MFALRCEVEQGNREVVSQRIACERQTRLHVLFAAHESSPFLPSPRSPSSLAVPCSQSQSRALSLPGLEHVNRTCERREVWRLLSRRSTSFQGRLLPRVDIRTRGTGRGRRRQACQTGMHISTVHTLLLQASNEAVMSPPGIQASAHVQGPRHPTPPDRDDVYIPQHTRWLDNRNCPPFSKSSLIACNAAFTCDETHR